MADNGGALPKQISVASLNGLEAGQVVREVVSRLGEKFAQHKRCDYILSE
jgi:hypothetical protein